MERMTKEREAEIRGNLDIGAAPGPDAVWRSACRDLLAEVDALRAEVVRYTQHATAAAWLPRPQLLEAVEVDEDVVGDLPRGPVMP